VTLNCPIVQHFFFTIHFPVVNAPYQVLYQVLLEFMLLYLKNRQNVVSCNEVTMISSDMLVS